MHFARGYGLTRHLGLGVLLFASTVLVSAQTGPQPQVITPVRQDVSPPLSQIPPRRDLRPRHERPEHELIRRRQAPVIGDAATQTATLTQSNPTTSGLNFDGVGIGLGSFAPNAAPPDTNGAVGLTQFVQWVNESFAVFDKSTGALLYGPVAGNTLWSGFGGPCQTDNDGDIIAQYDKIANRWIMTQFAVTGGPPYYQCVAVSKTSDATGAYNRYAYSFSEFNDYPKLGVWPDGYYLSFNMFHNNTFLGSQVCALNRSAMLTGATAIAVCFQLSSLYGGLLPSDLDGKTLPPLNSPNYFLAFDTNILQLWKFHVDFVTTSNSTFTGPTNISVTPFNVACNSSSTLTCVPQPGTSQKLDSLADRLMYRLAYRNFGDHEALVVNHSVDIGTGVSGVRWYELRNPGGTPQIWQQGTWSPDSDYRWMGSIAMDQAGNMAMGYSVSSSVTKPSIRYTVRTPSDPAGTMEAETSIMTGTGSQLNNLSRWGDYSSMAIDPVDDCTFWYTTEYLKANGTFNWSTRIASFSFPSCTALNSPSVSVSPSNLAFSSQAVGSSSTAQGVTLTNTGTGPLAISSIAAGENLLQNPTFSQGGWVYSAANNWLSSNSGVTTSLVPTTFSGFGPNMIHVTSGSQRGGILQVFGSVNTGPTSGYSSAWVYLNSGTVGIGAGNGGNTGEDVSTSTLNTWVHLQANFGVTPANEFIIYGQPGADFYVAFASAVANPSDFSQTNNCGSSLAGGASCTIQVTFSPTTTGPRSGSVWITDNAAGNPQTVSLSGTGITPISVSPSSLDFGTQTAGTSSAAKTVTLSNPGSISLTISSIIAGANLLSNPIFSQGGWTYSAANNWLVSNSSVTTSLVPNTLPGFGPSMIHVTSGSQRGGVLQVFGSVNTGPTSGYSSAWVYVVSGTVGIGAGNGGNTGEDISTSTLNRWVYLQASFGVTPANEYIIYGQPGSEFYVAFAGVVGQPSDFTQTNNCGSSLAAGNSCTINVIFTPSATGTRSGKLWITDNGVGSPQTVDLTGIGTTTVSLSSNSLSFSSQKVGTSSASQPITLTNLGGIPLAINGITAGTPNLLQNPTFSLGGWNYSVAVDWLLSNSSVTASLTPDTLPGFGPSMIHVNSGNQRGGILQVFGSVNTGPTGGYSSAWVYLLSGTVGIGAGNGGNTGEDVSTSALNQWVYLQGNFGVTPANEYIIYGQPGSEFYVAFASAVGQPSDFSQTNNCGSSLAPGNSCTINVTFTPTATGTRNGTLWITDIATGSPQAVTLTGSGTP